MLPVATSGGVTISCPENGRYSFFNSPYPSHRLMMGVDIYPDSFDDGFGRSPISGEIQQVRRVKAPPGRGFTALDHDTVTIIDTPAHDKVVKILHIDTTLAVGESIRLGDVLGPMIRSGY